MFKYAVRNGIIEHNTTLDVDYRQFRTRCKPSASHKEPYSDDERKRILDYLADKTDVYSLSHMSILLELRRTQTVLYKLLIQSL